VREAPIRLREEGACYAYSRADGSAYSFARSEFDALRTAWMKGEAFFTGTLLYGSTGTVKLGDIVAVVDSSAEHILAGLADHRANEIDDKADDLLYGTD
jgi:hypothetical protein